ncbi:MAG TPA: DUF1759 domain-containing protein, partial [Gammaproteobacteria bacterium]|nr:DUF1759 domain-containing protein [Gammaproteobacteria bacterium]
MGVEEGQQGTSVKREVDNWRPLKGLQGHEDEGAVDWSSLIKGKKLNRYFDPEIRRENIDDKLKVRPFSGEDYTEWSHFQRAFEIAVNKQRSVAWDKKMMFLLSHLKGEAYRLVSYLPLSLNGLQMALRMLVKRYSNKKEILVALNKQMTNMEALDLRYPDTLAKAQALLYNMVFTMGKVKGLSKTHLEITLFNSLRMEKRTERDFEDFMRGRQYDNRTLDAFDEWLANVLETRRKLGHQNNLTFMRDKGDSNWEATTAATLTTPANSGGVRRGPKPWGPKQPAQRGDSSSESDDGERVDVCCATNEEQTFAVCGVCQMNNHRIPACRKFIAMTMRDRRRVLRKI